LGTGGDAEGVAAERTIVVETVRVIVCCDGASLDTALECGDEMEAAGTEGDDPVEVVVAIGICGGVVCAWGSTVDVAD
jgi:hypothetical protein